MRQAARIIGHFFWIFLLMQSGVAGADLFQWTDANEVIHFTDNLYNVPQSVRASAKLVIRKDYLVSSKPSHEVDVTAEPVPPDVKADTQKGSRAESEPSGPISITHSPQEVNIVVVTSNARRPKIRPCDSNQNCKPSFRPDFNSRQYIHPSVFDEGSRQYIHP